MRLALEGLTGPEPIPGWTKFSSRREQDRTRSRAPTPQGPALSGHTACGDCSPVPALTDTSGPGGPCGRGSFAGDMALLGRAFFARVSSLPRDPGPLRVRQGGVGEDQVRFYKAKGPGRKKVRRARFPGAGSWKERGCPRAGSGGATGFSGRRPMKQGWGLGVLGGERCQGELCGDRGFQDVGAM